MRLLKRVRTFIEMAFFVGLSVTVMSCTSTSRSGGSATPESTERMSVYGDLENDAESYPWAGHSAGHGQWDKEMSQSPFEERSKNQSTQRNLNMRKASKRTYSTPARRTQRKR